MLSTMPTARHSSAAVHIPLFGDLILGGIAKRNRLRTAELLNTLEMNNGRDGMWRNIIYMIKPRWNPSAVYFDNCIFVVSPEESTMEMLPIRGGQFGQWTLLRGCDTPNQWPSSMCVHNGHILLAGE